MPRIKTILYASLLVYVSYLTVILATDYQTFAGRNHLPFTVWVIDTIDLFIHEGGHFFFAIFGRFMQFLGGTLMQLLIPIAMIVVLARTGPRGVPFALYWLGQSTVNASVYIADAPYQRLRLISRHAMHDWRWILGYLGMVNVAEDLASVVNFIGILACAAGIGLGVYFVVQDFRTSLGSGDKDDVTPPLSQ